MRDRSPEDQADADAREVDKGQVSKREDMIEGKDMAGGNWQMHDPVHADSIAPGQFGRDFDDPKQKKDEYETVPNVARVVHRTRVPIEKESPDGTDENSEESPHTDRRIEHKNDDLAQDRFPRPAIRYDSRLKENNGAEMLNASADPTG